MAQPYRILHVLDHSIPLHSGYAFRTRAILREQHALGWLTFHITSPKHYDFNGLIEESDGLQFFRTPPISPVVDKIPVINQVTIITALARRMRTVIADTQPDLLHVHSPCLNGLAALLANRRTGLPFVYEMRASWEDAAVMHGTTVENSIRYRLSRRLESLVLRRADRITTICQGLRDDIASRDIDARKITVIPNAVDVGKFDHKLPVDESLRESLDLGNRIVIGFAGSFYSYEGLELLLRGMPRIVSQVPNIVLLLIGGGPEEKNLRALAADLSLEDRVIFAGRVPHSEVQRYNGLVDIFVYPRLASRLTETVTPLKPLEAMASRRLVLASDVGGHRELIRDGHTGMLFRAGSVDSLSEALIALIRNQNAWEPIKEAGRRFVESERTWQNSVLRYRDVYAGAVSRDRSPRDR